MPGILSRTALVFCLLSSPLGLTGLRADVKMPLIFGDHMVLQQAIKLPVWGWAAPGEKVTVSFARQTVEALAGPDGKWRVDLASVAADGKGQVLTVSGKNTLSFQDVLVGDVWIASGQSNMELGLASDPRGMEAAERSNDLQLRLFVVKGTYNFDPQPDLAAASATSPVGKWQVCTPEFLKTKLGTHNFSATAYFFARDIRQATGIPVGMIGAYVGGTPAESWTSLSGLGKNPALLHYLSERQKVVDAYPARKAEYPQKQAEYRAALEAWKLTSAGQAFEPLQAQWNAAVVEAKATGKAVPPPPPKPLSYPQGLPAPDGGNHVPATLFNGMISPLIPYAIKGVIWYQGESNGSPLTTAREYAILFPRMISDWREKWEQGDFPFIYVQLANFMAAPKMASQGNWPWVRDAQLQTLELPHTGMASAVDIGNPADIHPKDKYDVGHRLALAARHLVYGEKDLVYSGPIYDSMTVEGNKIRLTFTNRGGGLVLGVPPWTPAGVPPQTPTELTGFGIAGADRQFVWAKANFDGDAVVVTSDQVAAPLAVRYNWADNPSGNLYNKEGLPASPFRTDAWDQ